MTTALEILAEIRAAGWAVAVHNDYRLNGEAHTFWLFTHSDEGRYVKGEGRTDAEALAICRAGLDALAPLEELRAVGGCCLAMYRAAGGQTDGRPCPYHDARVPNLVALLRQVLPPHPIIGCCDLIPPEDGWPTWAEQVRTLLGGRP